MQFHLEFPVEPLQPSAQYDQRYLLMGSCFSEGIGGLLTRYKFNTLVNPHGILFNPVSVVQALEGYLHHRKYIRDDLFYRDGLWHSWDHHSLFSDADPDHCLERINHSGYVAAEVLRNAHWLILSFGSAHVYRLKEDGRIVGNCHKIPGQAFDKILLKPERVIALLDNFLHQLFQLNARIRVIFTVSPVRYVRDGMVESNLSKATLLYSVHHLVKKFDRLHYFPAYELVMDDLRDYRFFTQDLVHPNEQAVHYVWAQFIRYAMDPASRELVNAVQEILQAVRHRPRNPGSDAHQLFVATQLEKIRNLESHYPFLDFSREKTALEGRLP